MGSGGSYRKTVLPDFIMVTELILKEWIVGSSREGRNHPLYRYIDLWKFANSIHSTIG